MNQRDVVREGYDQIADTYDEKRTGAGPSRDLAEDFATEIADRLSGTSGLVLDAGCGAGRPVLETLTERHDVVGLDISTGQLQNARRRVPDAGLCQADLANLPFASNTFDGIASYHAIIHVPKSDHEQVLSEFNRVLRPNGDLLVVMGNNEWEGTSHDWLDADTEMTWSYFGQEQNRETVTEAGFEIEDTWEFEDELGGTFAIFRARA